MHHGNDFKFPAQFLKYGDPFLLGLLFLTVCHHCIQRAGLSEKEVQFLNQFTNHKLL